MTKSEFFDRDCSHYYFDDLDKVADYCKKYWPKDTRNVIKIADDAGKNRFTFQTKWDLEQYHKPIQFEKEIDWRYQPEEDAEFVYQFNRHRYFISLGQAYALTKNEDYAKTYVNHILHWIENEPIHKENSKNTAWRTIEAGFRGEYWSKAIHYFRKSPFLTDDVIHKIYESMIGQANYIAKCDGPYHLISNWGVIEYHGLFELAVTLPQSPQTKKWIKLALSRLEKMIEIQVLDDGVHWEQSPMYHNEVLHCFQDVLILAKRNHINVGKTILDKVKQMSYANLAWIKPNGHHIMQGDSDDLSIKEYTSISAYLFKNPEFKYLGMEKLDFDSIWDIGYQGAMDYEKILPSKPSVTSIALKDSGNYYMRSTWEEDANLLHFHCGTLGAGHGHSDKLHIDLVAHGEDILVDSGRYTYVNGKERFYFKDPSAHNTITVDDKDFTICKDSWECEKLSQPVKQSFKLKDKCEFVQGGHLGYMDLSSPVFVNRKIIHFNSNIYIIVDEMYSSYQTDHTYQQYFHFNEKGRLQRITEGKVRYLGEKAVADFYFLNPLKEQEILKTRISRHYNHYEYNQTIKNEFVGRGFTSQITVIITKEKSKEEELEGYLVKKVPVKSALKNKIYSNKDAEAIKIKTKEDDYVLIVCHQEVNSPTDLTEAENCIGFGNVILFDANKEKEIGTVLHY